MGLVGEAPMTGTASCLPLALWRGHLGHLGGFWVWGKTEWRVEGGFGVEGEGQEVAVCAVWVVVVAGGSSVGSLGERGAGEGQTGAEAAVGCVV